MTSPYTGSTSSGTHAGDTQSIPTVNTEAGNYAVAPEDVAVEQRGTPEYTGAYEGEHFAGDRGMPMTEAGQPDVGGTSVGDLIGEVTRDFSTLMRQELDLAKAELKVEAKKAGQGAGMFGAAGFAGYMVLLFLSLALMWGLSNVLDTGWAGLIVAGVWAVIGAVSFVMGRARFRQVNPKPERTVDTLQQVPGALKPN
jgi:Putative Actinobacterial Holin-X, holin superfamily III